jgi:hypothetical protein
MVPRSALFTVHESASRGECSHEGQVAGNSIFAWPAKVSAQSHVKKSAVQDSHDEQMALLQQSSL